MFTYLWIDIYENLFFKSVGLNLFSLLGSSSSSSVDASSFGCVVILSLYLTMNFVIYSLIVGTFKSVCKTLLDTHTHTHIYIYIYIYHRAYTIARKTLFWYLCNLSMFEILAVPQRVTITNITFHAFYIEYWHSRELQGPDWDTYAHNNVSALTGLWLYWCLCFQNRSNMTFTSE
jgi:hypothetical protein